MLFCSHFPVPWGNGSTKDGFLYLLSVHLQSFSYSIHCKNSVTKLSPSPTQMPLHSSFSLHPSRPDLVSWWFFFLHASSWTELIWTCFKVTNKTNTHPSGPPADSSKSFPSLTVVLLRSAFVKHQEVFQTLPLFLEQPLTAHFVALLIFPKTQQVSYFPTCLYQPSLLPSSSRQLLLTGAVSPCLSPQNCYWHFRDKNSTLCHWPGAWTWRIHAAIPLLYTLLPKPVFIPLSASMYIRSLPRTLSISLYIMW